MAGTFWGFRFQNLRELNIDRLDLLECFVAASGNADLSPRVIALSRTCLPKAIFSAWDGAELAYVRAVSLTGSSSSVVSSCSSSAMVRKIRTIIASCVETPFLN
jgi:hypothetical protein